MEVDVSKQRDQQDASKDAKKARERVAQSMQEQPQNEGHVAQAMRYLREGFPQLRWGLVLLLGIVSGVLMPLSVSQSGPLSLLAGIVPVGAGLIIGRRVRGYYGLHGFMTGVIAAVLSLIIINVVIFYTPLGASLQQATASSAVASGGTATIPSLESIAWQLSSFIPFSLLTFCTFGAVMSGRTEERNRAMREEVESRGGRMEKPGTIRTVEDLRGLSLPQLGSYVTALFKKNGFQFKDYRFLDKDKHLDVWMEYEEEVWHFRLTVQDKVSPGTIESLVQDMRREGTQKGVVVTSTEFTPSAQKSAKGRSVVLIDGPTLYQMAEK
jgi:hypothetical protein